MSVQSFHFSKRFDRGQCLAQSDPRILDDAGPALKLIDSQPGKGAPCPAGGQGMTRPGNIIAEDSWGPWPEKNGARGKYFFRETPRMTRHNLAMFGSETVYQFHRAFHVAGLDEPAVILQCSLDKFPAVKMGQLSFHFFFHLLKQAP